jgi:4-fold beta-flower domain-containing protein
LDFYSMTGDVVCHSPEGQYFFLWDGKPVAYLAEDRVYAFSGRQLGWFENGWLYDRANRPALFTAEASGGPARPIRKARPVRSNPQRKPQKAVRQIGLTKPARSFDWSEASGTAYFEQ